MHIISGVTPGNFLLRFLRTVLNLIITAGLTYGTEVEFSIDKPTPGNSVGTCEYEPTKTEKIWFDRLSEDDRVTYESMPDDGISSKFTLSGHRDQFVSWWGIVRNIERHPDGTHARLLIQNTYGDPLTDCHTQTVDIGGAGDFETVMTPIPKDLIPLVLVRVYGKVTDEHDGRPVITADYLRVWHWFQFNFMAHAADHGNPEWKKRRKLEEDDRIYHIGVSLKYYADRLGPTKEEWEEIVAFHRGQTLLEFDPGGRMREPSASYVPTEWEQPYYDRLRKEDRVTIQSKPEETEHASFRLAGHGNQYVSWFGIVREVSATPGKRGGALLIENRYFKGSGDAKLQTVSIRGAGNFKTEVTNLVQDLVPLTLVRVYGTVVREEDGVPVIEATFIRGWQWTQFNFDDYGEDHSDPRWAKNLRVKPGPSVKQAKVTADYYIDYLGANKEQAEAIRWAFKWREQEEKEMRELRNGASTPTASPDPSP